MKKDQFLDIMNEIDDELILGAKEPTAKKGSKALFRFASVAACLCLIIIAAVAIPLMKKDEIKTLDSVTDGKDTSPQTDNSQGNNENIPPQVITAFEAEKTLGDYRLPEAGEVGYTAAVGEAFNEYRGEDVYFLLAFSIHKEQELLSGEELTEEYQRLSDLGYKLYMIEDHWTYYGKGEKKYVPTVVCLATTDEISSFKVNENYGYFFYFAKNGDGSPISFDGAEVVTDFDVPYA